MKSKGISLDTLMATNFGELKWTVPAILPEGLTILAGKPKIGKSWLTLNLSLAVGAGRNVFGDYETNRGDVLHLALEDNARRLKSRINTITDNQLPRSDVHFRVSCPTVCEGGLGEIRDWIDSSSNPRLVIIDTLQMFTGSPDNNSSRLYEKDYERLKGLKKLASNKKVSILLVHHLRKMEASDYIDSVTGTSGLTGCADTIWVLERGREETEAVLRVTGRDVEEEAYALKEARTGVWEIQGTTEYLRSSRQRQEIISLLKEAKEALSPVEIADELDKNRSTVRTLLRKLVDSGQLESTSYGRYRISLQSSQESFQNLFNNNNNNNINGEGYIE